jgi:hypothetical protein
MSKQAPVAQKNHTRAVRFFWGLLIAATTISLIGNVAHAMLPFIPRVGIQIGAAAVPPLVLLAAVHGIAVAVRAGASGSVYRCAVVAVALIGVGAFSISFLALRDLMLAIGYGTTTAWVFPAIVDTAIAVSTLMLVALGDKPVRRTRATTVRSGAEAGRSSRGAQGATQNAKSHVKPDSLGGADSGGVQSATLQASVADVEVAAQLISSGATTQPVNTVVAVLDARRRGASINAAAKAAGINYRTAQRIVEWAERPRAKELQAAS